MMDIFGQSLRKQELQKYDRGLSEPGFGGILGLRRLEEETNQIR
jgi:hypothetical protein